MLEAYFAYGSNLHREDFTAWCAANGHAIAGLDGGEPAWLPDTEAVFHYRAERRGGGALSLRARRGCAVPGVVFRVDGAARRALDAKEGAPHRYAAVPRIALSPGGLEAAVFTYEAQASACAGAHVPPTEEYLRVVGEGLRAHGLSDEHVRSAARSLDAPPWPSALFVYGTLRSGESRHALLARRGIRRLAPATVEGALLDLGEYPGLRWCAGGRVHGERIELEGAALADALAELDEVEGFLGYGAAGSLYRRVVTIALDDRGRREPAWTYALADAAPGAPAIACGDWCAR